MKINVSIWIFKIVSISISTDCWSSEILKAWSVYLLEVRYRNAICHGLSKKELVAHEKNKIILRRM